MTTIERTARVMESDPRIRAAFPGWFWPHCATCGDECEIDVNDEPFCMNHGGGNLVYKFGPPTQGQGPDVWASLDMTDPPNLHHAFAVRDLLNGGVATNRGENLLIICEGILF